MITKLRPTHTIPIYWLNKYKSVFRRRLSCRQIRPKQHKLPNTLSVCCTHLLTSLEIQLQIMIRLNPLKVRWLPYILPGLQFKSSTFCPWIVFLCVCVCFVVLTASTYYLPIQHWSVFIVGTECYLPCLTNCILKYNADQLLSLNRAYSCQYQSTCAATLPIFVFTLP
jgi:hypothetical protein